MTGSNSASLRAVQSSEVPEVDCEDAQPTFAIHPDVGDLPCCTPPESLPLSLSFVFCISYSEHGILRNCQLLRFSQKFVASCF